MINVQENISLKKYNSFGIEAKSSSLIAFDNIDQLIDLLNKETYKYQNFRIIGSGTNLLFITDFDGYLLHPENKELQIIEESEKDLIIEAGAGWEWDSIVEWAVNKGYYGLENLSLIPGTIGAAVVQNIGAYGVELGDHITGVEVIDILSGESFHLNKEECRFSYRDSIFKQSENKQWLVWKVRIKLSKKADFDLSYGNLAEKVHNLDQVNLHTVRNVIIETRRSKLPDPESIGNAGSFFKNPIVTQAKFDKLTVNFAGLPSFPCKASGFVKIPAAWLIDKAGWKGYRSNQAGVYHKQALVLVNHGGATGIEIFELAEKIQESVYSKFGISLEPEVTIIGSSEKA